MEESIIFKVLFIAVYLIQLGLAYQTTNAGLVLILKKHAMNRLWLRILRTIKYKVIL